jgi:Recombinase
MVYNMLTNPVYGGTYAYGKTASELCYDGPISRKSIRRKPRAEWLSLRPGSHEGYVDWARSEAIRNMLANNLSGANQAGAAKRGASLLAGLMRCRPCGRKMMVYYTGRTHDTPRYACFRGRLDSGEPPCISFGGLGVDDAIEDELLRVLEPGAIEAALEADQQKTQRDDEVLEALKRDLEAARYTADKAFRQYDAADPANRRSTIDRDRAKSRQSRRKPWPGWSPWPVTRHGTMAIRTSRARHAREHGPVAGHECLPKLVQGTVCKILGQEDIKPHKVRYYLEQRDAEFEQKKMAEVLCVYRQVQILKKGCQISETAQAGGDRLLRRKARNPGDRNDGTGFAAAARRASDLRA